MKKTIVTLAALLTVAVCGAKVKLANVFSSHMVLQQEKPLKVWGTATPGTQVKVKIGRSSAKATAAADGRWAATLAPLKATAKPVRFSVSGDGSRIELADVLVGEVWLASGQSNMEYSMAAHPHYAKPKKGDPDRLQHEYEQASNPMIRLMYVKKNLKTDTLPTAGWQRLGRESLKPFSAPAYFFAKALQDSLGVPVGIITSAWGGTAIETWTPLEQYTGSPAFAAKMDGSKLQTNGQRVGERWRKLVEPMAQMAMRGFLWYQGEQNVIMGETDIYTEKQRLLVEGWRKAWADSLMPFYYVQLAPFRYTGSKQDVVAKTRLALPRFWDAQERCQHVIPHSAMVVTTDLPENLGDIHPPYKWVVGERLALVALNKTYGRTGVVCSGPTLRGIRVDGDSIIVEFDNVGGGLTTRDGKAPDWFWAKKSGSKFGRVEAVLSGNTVRIPAKGLPRKTVLRFGWDEEAQPNLINREGLPAVPFARQLTIDR